MYGHEGLKDFAVERGEDINKLGMKEFLPQMNSDALGLTDTV